MKKLPLIGLVTALPGCVITIGPWDGDDTSTDDKTSVLPAPENPIKDDPQLDEAQQERQDEVDHFIAEVIYQGSCATSRTGAHWGT
jgi:hypothetical protein